MRKNQLKVCFTVDVEQDCPPYLTTYEGVQTGLPRLLTLLAEEMITGTFFVTGQIGREIPQAVEAILKSGHELGCHGDTHRRFSRLNRSAVRQELERATRTLGSFGQLHAFRAPYLDLPEAYLSLLPEYGLGWDSSLGLYKVLHWRRFIRPVETPGLRRIPVSLTSSALRLPGGLTRLLLTRPVGPLVLYVHPWEFVDWRRSHLRWDCRFNTGAPALEHLHQVLRALQARQAAFLPLTAL